MPKKAFVSYAHESAEHKNQVLQFATLLRQNGVEAVLDVWAADARIDWYAWALKEMTEADYIVVVASPKYLQVADGAPSREHRGVQSEAALLRDLVWDDRATWLPKILPVLLPDHQIQEIPRFLQPSTASRYEVRGFTPRGIEDLLRVILSQPSHIPPPVAEPPVLQVLSGEPGGPVTWSALDAPVDVRWLAEIIDHQSAQRVIELHLVPRGNVSRCSVRRLRELGPELLEIGRLHGIFASSTPPEVGYSTSAAWAFSEYAGLAVLRSGQRSAWCPNPGVPLYERLVIDRLALGIELLMDINVDRPESWVPAIGTDRSGALRRIGVDATESITDYDLRRRPTEVAEELAARLMVALRDPAPPAPKERQKPRTGNIHNEFSGNASGTVIQVGQLFEADPKAW
jgi:hypothetical protein